MWRRALYTGRYGTSRHPPLMSLRRLPGKVWYRFLPRGPRQADTVKRMSPAQQQRATRSASTDDDWIARDTTTRGRLQRVHTKKAVEWDANGDTALHVAVRANDLRAVHRFLKMFEDPSVAVNLKSTARCTSLHLAAECGHAEICRRLLAAGGPMAPIVVDGDGLTAICYAVANGHVECTRVLLAAEPDLGWIDRDGDGLLSYAVRCEQTACVRVLCEAGVDACAANREGRTPLHCAAKRGLVQVVKMLLDAGADPTAVDRKGDTPLSDATTMLDSRAERAVSLTGAVDFAAVAQQLREATNEACALATSKQLLYVPHTPSSSGAAATNASADRGARAFGGLARRRQTPTTRARGLLREVFAPGAEPPDCSICLVPVMLRGTRTDDGGQSSEPNEAEQAAITACGHVYHLACYQQMVAFSGGRGVVCPNCRDELTLKHAKPLSPPAIAPTPTAAAPSPAAAAPSPCTSAAGAIGKVATSRSPVSERGTTASSETALSALEPAPIGGTRAGGTRRTSSRGAGTRNASCSAGSSSLASDVGADENASGNTAEASGGATPLAQLSRRQLQARAKAAGIAANLKTLELLERLSALSARIERASAP